MCSELTNKDKRRGQNEDTEGIPLGQSTGLRKFFPSLKEDDFLL
jgi:hypothetical protein